MEDKCPICLNNIDKRNNIKKKLSCGHSLHFCCFRDLIYHKNNNYFIKCPICRRRNINIDNIYKESIDNIKILCSNKLNTMNCLYKINGKRRCKRKPYLLNYGYCYQHHKDILKEDKYELMLKFIYLILCQRNSIFTRLQIIDLGKQIIIHRCNSNSDIDDVMFYFYKFLNINDIRSIQDYSEMYKFYNLKKPEPNWFRYCIKNSILI